MTYIPPEIVEKAKEMDVLTYLQNYEPNELVKVGNGTYSTKTHDSIRISNGLWNWFSRGVGGKSVWGFIHGAGKGGFGIARIPGKDSLGIAGLVG